MFEIIDQVWLWLNAVGVHGLVTMLVLTVLLAGLVALVAAAVNLMQNLSRNVLTLVL